MPLHKLTFLFIHSFIIDRTLILFKKMIRSVLKEFLRPIQLISSSHLRSSYTNQTVDDWISSLSEDKQERVRLIQNEIALKLAEEQKMPQLQMLSKADYEEMLDMSNNRRRQYYNYLHSSKTADSNDSIKRMIRKQINDTKQQLSTHKKPKTNHIEYGLHQNTQFLRITEQTMNKWRNFKVWRAMRLNEPALILDCGFNDTMSKREMQDLARQINHSFAHNRMDRKPFVLNLCNMSPDSKLWPILSHKLTNFEKLPWNISPNDITDVFPVEKLVYLSPDAPDALEFNADDCYVLGAIVDKGNRQPLTLAKSKRLGIRAARLPLEKYIKFNSHKTLTLDQMTRIMLELKRTQDWKRALKYVPARHILG
ncbi:mitochondrial ribonuclease P protein 1 homolog [Contarinia nasturtii]|uniref:mitochondrial ribonuclease P protein 1 homolog n=1 Tax=Contarinia nasturtii TaxID=265458 RepID=UPI0012D4426E|nr:mitochondrial ribonuclease P protein 1 homolog [Contarinia nasturtii]XP_031635412.1 mitochondrial ribonuclease P protein 1 homolog [Contarinia nasturtii]XP_031635413.1 mitochondrial ribonuclease P protein 1 homolog [Contarinia nasturtii]